MAVNIFNQCDTSNIVINGGEISIYKKDIFYKFVQSKYGNCTHRNGSIKIEYNK